MDIGGGYEQEMFVGLLLEADVSEHRLRAQWEPVVITDRI
jgi:hypothetical protein